MIRLVLSHLVQILVAALGGLVFHWLGVPAAWLSGSAIAATLWGLTGWAVPLPKALADAAMLTSGAAMGAAVTPAAIDAMSRGRGGGHVRGIVHGQGTVCWAAIIVQYAVACRSF